MVEVKIEIPLKGKCRRPPRGSLIVNESVAGKTEQGNEHP
jgi:hypothetical protein